MRNRKVLVTRRGWEIIDGKITHPVILTYEARFLQFGCDFCEFEAGPGNYTTAVVEDDNGNILTIPLQEHGLPTIQFIAGGDNA